MEFGGHPFDIPIIYNDPNANDFDESHIQRPDTVIFPRSYFRDSSGGQNRETCPICDPSTVHPSIPKSHGQNKDLETATHLRYTDISKQSSEINTDIETEYEPTEHPTSRQS